MGKEKTFREYINALPKRTLIGLSRGRPGGKIVSVASTISDLIRKYSDARYLKSLLQGLDRESGAVFRILLLEGRLGADLAYVGAHLKKADPDRLGRVLSHLQNAFLVFGVKSTPYRYYVFPEIRAVLADSVIEEGREAVRAVKTVHPKKACGDALFRDTLLLLLFLVREGLKKTKSGGLNKKQLDALFQNFENRPEFTGCGPDNMPPLLQMMFSFLMKKGFVEDRPDGLSASAAGARWLDAPAATQAADWYQFVLRGYKEEKMLLVLRLLAGAGTALHTGDITAFFHSRAEGDARPMPEVFERLFHAGLVDLVNGTQNTAGFMISDRGRELLAKKAPKLESADRVTVMPTFEIVVPRMLETPLLKKLFMICDLVKSDAAFTFRISKESLFHGLDRGLKPADVMAFLEAVSAHSIPQNVLFSLNEWLDGHGVLAFEMHFVLRAKKPEIFDKVKSILKGSPYVADELPGTGFSIDIASYHEVFSILSRLGLSPKPYAGPKRFSKVPEAGPGTILDSYVKKYGAGESDMARPFIYPKEQKPEKPYKARAAGKYGRTLKRLPYHELVHVLNYSILMEQAVEAELKNSGGRIRVVPQELHLNQSEPKLTAVNAVSGETLDIKLDDIDKIGVGGEQ